ncbi:uncharacterized serine-rich protein C215.13-like [Prosopis cineraria]|uniref:uncharacterized serine-rich protein C215.13-like n=1 Tax=Prosopis cineraria TaxID=364024 RepID=UPI00240F3AF4|nr:uncharacterized serine-rich protein C215.13-like [Prosopis cineraria]
MIPVEGIKGGGARVGAGEDDMGDGMQCSDHPYKNNPGGICAFCLQEKLGRLVSSSFPLAIRPSSSSSSSPSFRSDMAPSASATSAAPSSSSLSFSARPASALKSGAKDSRYHQYYIRRARLPFHLAKKKNKASSNNSSSFSSAAPSSASDIIFKRSKSSAAPGTGRFLNDAGDGDIAIESFRPRKRNGFWSFLYLPSKSSASAKKLDTKSFGDNRNSPRVSTITRAIAGLSSVKQKDKFLCADLGRKTDVGGEEDDSPNSQPTASVTSLERKVSRSRSVGCGSRSFSGDFFERISTGFGDCTLRRVESQREGKSKAVTATAVMNHHHHQCMKERVKCAGIFSGLMMTSSSSSSSSSSYWVSSSADNHVNGKSAAVAISHGRTRSWGWAFASPMRAFSTKNKRDIIRDASDHKNAATPKPNLSDISSLLSVGG